MSKRFEIVSFELLDEFTIKEEKYGSTVTATGSVTILRDNQTGMMYLQTKSGVTPLLGRDGKPMTATYQISI